MTLLISAKSIDGFIITADGRSNVNDKQGHSVSTDKLQKIFPHSSLPIAIAHHGENVLQGVPVKDTIESFLNAAISSSEMSLLAAQLFNHFDAAVIHTLSASSKRNYCGFWLAGYDTQKGFSVYEIDWTKSNCGIQRKITPHGDLLIGGDCGTPIKQYLSEPIDSTYCQSKLMSNASGYAIKLSDRLYDLVMKTSPTTCGGHKHQLYVSKKNIDWIVSPI